VKPPTTAPMTAEDQAKIRRLATVKDLPETARAFANTMAGLNPAGPIGMGDRGYLDVLLERHWKEPDETPPRPPSRHDLSNARRAGDKRAGG